MSPGTKNTKHLGQPILGITVLALFPFMRKWLRRKQLRALEQRTVAAQAKRNSSNLEYGELDATPPRQPNSPAEKQTFPSSSKVGRDNTHVFT